MIYKKKLILLMVITLSSGAMAGAEQDEFAPATMGEVAEAIQPTASMEAISAALAHDPRIVELAGQENLLRAKLALARSTYSDEHPAVLAAKRELQAVVDEMDHRVGAYAAFAGSEPRWLAWLDRHSAARVIG